MLKWFNRGKKRKSNIAFGAPSDGIDGSNTMPIESTVIHLEKKVIVSSSSEIAKSTALTGKKVGSLD